MHYLEQIHSTVPSLSLDGNALLLILLASGLRVLFSLLNVMSPGSQATTINWKLEVTSILLAYCIYFILIMMNQFKVDGGWAFVIGFAPRTVLPLLTSFKPGSKINQALAAPEKPTDQQKLPPPDPTGN